MDMRVYMGHFT